ncbi:Acetolactate synthase large subunit [Eubacterium plexicaudatum ASF492]|uniref:Acetolactate synthase I/II/III large subunit n=1 Tax=Eubacterium plexicaudatum ASF492 TaxID=1235802 RepID=N2A8J1_9FIRM|nr:Acetolactate synthase large subunit [Eubacterium plexicaudatum ASF492]
MRMKAADYVADMLVKHEIAHVFTVTGGGAMHLNHAFGHKEGLTCIYQHHEQACAMAAESYARIRGRMAAVCVTTGPGGTNALTGVLGSWLDSIPMLVISGQVRTDMTARSTGLGIRALGDQEFDITRAVSCMTKYAVMVTRPEDIRYCLEKALFIAKSGRPGPCWLDIPLDVQAAWLQTEELAGYDPANDPDYLRVMPAAVTDETVDRIIQKVRCAKRPVLHAGNGVRIAGAQKLLLEVAEKLYIPVVTGWNSIDLIADEHPLYAGRAGIMGDRPGNWAVQCSDVLLSVGSRLSVRQVGYAQGTWARDACTIVQDIDNEELKKPNIHVDMPVWADAYALLEKLNRRLSGEPSADGSAPHPQGNAGEADDAAMLHQAWIQKCRNLRERYPVVQKKHFKQRTPANVYAFIHTLSEALPEGRITVVGNGSASVAGSHAFVIKPGQRFLINSGAASMGYDLPAAVGACIAAGYEEITCLTGDGSIQMNLQELQTIVHHRLPVKIFVINNEGYHSIRQTQRNYFKEPLVGVGTDSADLSFPSMEKLAWAYGFPYYKIQANDQLPKVTEILKKEGFCICEVFVDTRQCFEPKSATEQLADGRMVSLPLEDLAPRLPEEELKKIMWDAMELT